MCQAWCSDSFVYSTYFQLIFLLINYMLAIQMLLMIFFHIHFCPFYHMETLALPIINSCLIEINISSALSFLYKNNLLNINLPWLWLIVSMCLLGKIYEQHFFLVTKNEQLMYKHTFNLLNFQLIVQLEIELLHQACHSLCICNLNHLTRAKVFKCNKLTCILNMCMQNLWKVYK